MKLCKMCKKKSGFLQTVIFHKTWKSFLKVKVESKKIFESKLWKKSGKKSPYLLGTLKFTKL